MSKPVVKVGILTVMLLALAVSLAFAQAGAHIVGTEGDNRLVGGNSFRGTLPRYR